MNTIIKFLKPQNESDIEDENEENVEIDLSSDDIKIKDSSILTNFKFLFKQGKKTVYEVNARTLINNSSIWELNRPIDIDFVQKMYEAMIHEKKTTNDVTIYSTISAFYDRDKNKISIFDGQHRLKAIQMFYKNKDFFSHPLNLIIDMYESTNKDTQELIQMYLDLNKTKVQIEEQLPSKEKESLSNIICKHFNKNAYNISTSNAHRPKLFIKDITDYIYTHDKLRLLNSDEVIKYLDFINEKFSEMSFEQIFKKEYKTNKEKCEAFYNRANNIGFFLGLRKKNKSKLDWNDITQLFF